MDGAALRSEVTRRAGRGLRWRARARAVRLWSRRRFPPGIRLVVGLLLMAGGLVGFLPVVGFWMFPLGVFVAAADIVPLWRWFRRVRGRR